MNLSSSSSSNTKASLRSDHPLMRRGPPKQVPLIKDIAAIAASFCPDFWPSTTTVDMETS